MFVQFEYFGDYELYHSTINTPFYLRLGGELGIVLHISAPLKSEYAKVKAIKIQLLFFWCTMIQSVLMTAYHSYF